MLSSDPNFLRISKGTYSLHCFHPEKEQLVKAPQPKKRKAWELGMLGSFLGNLSICYYMSEEACAAVWCYAEAEEELGSKVARHDGGGDDEVDSIAKVQ